MELRSVEAIAKVLQEAEVRYLVVGGLAVVAHGYERLTRDVDLVIQLERDNIIRGLSALVSIGYQLSVPITPDEFADPELREQMRQDKGMIVLKLWSDVHERTPVDVFISEPFDFDEEMKRARVEEVFPGIFLQVISLPCLYQMKESAGRDRDLIDISNLKKLDPYRK